jgi:hypothetical protein
MVCFTLTTQPSGLLAKPLADQLFKSDKVSTPFLKIVAEFGGVDLATFIRDGAQENFETLEALGSKAADAVALADVLIESVLPRVVTNLGANLCDL